MVTIFRLYINLDLYKVCMTSQTELKAIGDKEKILKSSQLVTNYSNAYSSNPLPTNKKLTYTNDNNNRNQTTNENNNYKPLNSPKNKTHYGDFIVSTNFTTNNPNRSQTDVNFIFNANEKCK